MALNPTALSALIKTKRLAALGDAGVDNAAMAADCNAIAQAVIEHFAAAAVVTVPPGVAVATAGSAAAQTGATTAPGVGSIA
jgi:hypothetical protein